MIKRLLGSFICCYVMIAPQVMAAERALPRILISFYDSKNISSPRMSYAHLFLEMPANHLGYDIHYYDINKKLPKISADIAGAIIWFPPGAAVSDAKGYLSWLDGLIAKKRKLIIVENIGLDTKQRSDEKIQKHYNQILRYIGLQDGNKWHAITHHARITHLDKDIVGFERPVGPVFPPFGSTKIITGKAQSHLKIAIPVRKEEYIADLIATNKNGGFIAEGYGIFHVVKDGEAVITKWFINPFEFLKKSLDVSLAPIPDVTTLNGRRIFYSHIDGDGWNNISEIDEYNKDKKLSAEVIQKEILEKYSDFPVTVGLITADIDPDCYGVEKSKEVARNIYALNNVEPSSHTHSHPYYWHYFTDYTPQKEEPILSRYPLRPIYKRSLVESIKGIANNKDWKTQYPPGYDLSRQIIEASPSPDHNKIKNRRYTTFNHENYDTPRSYGCTPFLLDQEITGSVAQINKLSPDGKKVRLIQWSGDTNPYETALKRAREAGLYNINGGNSRFDNEYPSYASVAPIGIKIGKERQIYSSNSNENTYTNLWTDRFFGFRYLKNTLRNTETPIRISPFNIYFHMYSGQKLASLNAVRENFEFARNQSIIPIKTSDYAAIANDFYNVRIIPIGNMRWEIENRGNLQTIRFNSANDKAIDFEQSSGVLGQFYYQNSLYISLDPKNKTPTISLKNNDNIGILPVENTPYLINSRWKINYLHSSKNLLTIHGQGYGYGEMSWMMPKSGKYLIKARKDDGDKTLLFEKKVQTRPDGVLHFSVDVRTPLEALIVTVEQTGS